MESGSEVTRTTREHGLMILRNDIVTLMESGVDLKTLATEACVMEDELTRFVLPGTSEKEWVAKFEFNKYAYRRVLACTERTIRKTNIHMNVHGIKNW